MEIVINFWAVIVCTIVSIILGFMWFGPLFGKAWMKEMGFSLEHTEDSKQKGMGTKQYVLMTLGSFLTAYVLAHAFAFASFATNTHGVLAGVSAGFWNWLGFIAPVTVGVVLWEGKSWKLWFIQGGYYLASLVIQGIILALW